MAECSLSQSFVRPLHLLWGCGCILEGMSQVCWCADILRSFVINLDCINSRSPDPLLYLMSNLSMNRGTQPLTALKSSEDAVA